MTPPGPATRTASGSIAQWWSQPRRRCASSAEGRGAALFIDADGRRLVLRHYRRGGWMAPLIARSLPVAGERADALVHRVASAVRHAAAPACRYRCRSPPATAAPAASATAPTCSPSGSQRCSSLAARLRARAVAAERLDRHRPLPAPLSRRRRVPRRSQCAQRAAERRAGGLAGGLRSRRVCAARASGATAIWCACAARSRRSPMRCRPSASPRPTGHRCSSGYFAARAAASPPHA